MRLTGPGEDGVRIPSTGPRQVGAKHQQGTLPQGDHTLPILRGHAGRGATRNATRTSRFFREGTSQHADSRLVVLLVTLECGSRTHHEGAIRRRLVTAISPAGERG